MKEDEINGASVTRRKIVNAYKILIGILNRGDHFGYLGMDGR
jgi:hypothetical protein